MGICCVGITLTLIVQVSHCHALMKLTRKIKSASACSPGCELPTSSSSSLQAQLSFMRYVSVCCVVGIIAGFCIGPGKLLHHMKDIRSVRVYNEVVVNNEGLSFNLKALTSFIHAHKGHGSLPPGLWSSLQDGPHSHRLTVTPSSSVARLRTVTYSCICNQ